MLSHHITVLSLLLLSILSATWSLPSCSDQATADYDYIVVGAGAGGGPVAARLAEAGFSVLVVDAGHKVYNVNTTVPLMFGRASDDSQLELNYTLDEYPPDFRFQKNDVWYPRARGVGGSTLHNALINSIANTKSDFDNLAAMFNDPTWSYESMRRYFTLIERNLYLPLSPDHGYSGWLSTNVNPDLVILNPMFLDLQLIDIVASLTIAGPPILDANARASVEAAGVSNVVFTVDEVHNRSSVYNRLVDVQSEATLSGSLQFLLDTLATKILLCNELGTARNGTTVVRAYGVQVAEGAGLPVASNFNATGGTQAFQTRNITARHEVIVSAGTFQSPQLLMLSGIGDRQQLSQFRIETVVDLPGVGKNLQDHDEVTAIWELKQNTSLLNGCTFLSDPAEDPCLAYWIESGHQNVYSFGPSFVAITTQSNASNTEPDIFSYWAPGYFPGFVRGFAQDIADHHRSLTVVLLKAHPSSRGFVNLTGPSPQDSLNIQKIRFQAAQGPQDVADLREALKRARGIIDGLTVAPWIEGETSPGSRVETDDEIDEYIYQNVFGHHACCTNKMGADDDPMTVLDGNFSVRGVAGLRVVDASSWPDVPGYFITTPTYMMSEKAANVIIAAASRQS